MASPDVERIRAAQQAIRDAAMRFSVEEALNGLAGVAAEAILTLPINDQAKLMQIFTAMVLDAIKRGRSGPATDIPILQ